MQGVSCTWICCINILPFPAPSLNSLTSNMPTNTTALFNTSPPGQYKWTPCIARMLVLQTLTLQELEYVNSLRSQKSGDLTSLQMIVGFAIQAGLSIICSFFSLVIWRKARKSQKQPDQYKKKATDNVLMRFNELALLSGKLSYILRTYDSKTQIANCNRTGTFDFWAYTEGLTFIVSSSHCIIYYQLHTVYFQVNSEDHTLN